MGTLHVPTLLEGILEATAAKAQAEARITTLRAALEDEARRRHAADGAAPSWNAPQLGRVRLDPAGEWTATVADAMALGSYVAERYPSEANVVLTVNADDAADVLQALEFIGVEPVEARVDVRTAWLDRWLKGLDLDVTEERDDNEQLVRTVVAQDPARLTPVPGIGVTRSEAKLVVSLDSARRTAAVQEARSTATALVEAAAGDEDDGPDLEALDVRRRELEDLHADQLATIAKGHGLGTSGTKASLAERIARAEAATGHVIRPASAIGDALNAALVEGLNSAVRESTATSPLPEGTEVEEVTTLPADQPVEEVPDAGDLDVEELAELTAEVEAQVAATFTERTEERADDLEGLGSREVLRAHAKRLGVSAAGTKRDVALRLAHAGHTAVTLTQEQTA